MSKSLAIAYSMKKKLKKAKKPDKPKHDPDYVKEVANEVGAEMDRERERYALGGSVKKGFPKRPKTRSSQYEKGVHKARLEVLEPGESDAGYSVQARDTKNAKEDHKVALKSLRSMKGPTSGKSGFASGGSVESGDPTMNMATGGDVSIAGCPKCGYSEGGQVANDTDMSADMLPNEFDDLVLRDDEEMEGYSKKSPMDDDLVDNALKKRRAKKA